MEIHCVIGLRTNICLFSIFLIILDGFYNRFFLLWGMVPVVAVFMLLVFIHSLESNA